MERDHALAGSKLRHRRLDALCFPEIHDAAVDEKFIIKLLRGLDYKLVIAFRNHLHRIVADRSGRDRHRGRHPRLGRLRDSRGRFLHGIFCRRQRFLCRGKRLLCGLHRAHSGFGGSFQLLRLGERLGGSAGFRGLARRSGRGLRRFSRLLRGFLRLHRREQRGIHIRRGRHLDPRNRLGPLELLVACAAQDLADCISIIIRRQLVRVRTGHHDPLGVHAGDFNIRQLPLLIPEADPCDKSHKHRFQLSDISHRNRNGIAHQQVLFQHGIPELSAVGIIHIINAEHRDRRLKAAAELDRNIVHHHIRGNRAEECPAQRDRRLRQGKIHIFRLQGRIRIFWGELDRADGIGQAARGEGYCHERTSLKARYIEDIPNRLAHRSVSGLGKARFKSRVKGGVPFIAIGLIAEFLHKNQRHHAADGPA